MSQDLQVYSCDDQEIIDLMYNHCLECNITCCKTKAQHFQISFLSSQHNRISDYIQYSIDLKNQFKGISSNTCYKCQRPSQGTYFIVQYAVGIYVILCKECKSNAKGFQFILQTPYSQVSFVNAPAGYWCIQCKEQDRGKYSNLVDLFSHSQNHTISLTMHQTFQEINDLYYNHKYQDSSDQFKVPKICKNEMKQKCNKDQHTYLLKLKEKNTQTTQYYCETCFNQMKLKEHKDYDKLILIRDRSLK